MAEDVLALNGLSIELLTQLSYRSQLGLSLKRTLRHFEREALIAELVSMTEWLDEQTGLSEIALDYRIKSYASIVGKYERYFNSSRHVSQVFNDVLGFRAFCDSYNSVLALTSTSFSVADLSRGKAVDDGYRVFICIFNWTIITIPLKSNSTLYTIGSLTTGCTTISTKRHTPMRSDSS